MVNNTCYYHCPLCCNRQYDVEKLPVVTVEDLRSIDTICLTGGQPMHDVKKLDGFIHDLLDSYKNIETVIIYINGDELTSVPNLFAKYELSSFLRRKTARMGFTMSPKSKLDWEVLQAFRDEFLTPNMRGQEPTHRFYCFSQKEEKWARKLFPEGVEIMRREWQKDFKPAPNTFFRRLPVWIS